MSVSGTSADRLLPFVSRHDGTPEQDALARALGYSGLRRLALTFGPDPRRDLEAAGLRPGAALAIVAPPWVALALLRVGYTLVEFVNAPEARDEGEFSCVGAYEHRLLDSRFVGNPAQKSEEVELRDHNS
jgi:hypothetical protein